MLPALSPSTWRPIGPISASPVLVGPRITILWAKGQQGLCLCGAQTGRLSFSAEPTKPGQSRSSVKAICKHRFLQVAWK